MEQKCFMADDVFYNKTNYLQNTIVLTSCYNTVCLTGIRLKKKPKDSIASFHT